MTTARISVEREDEAGTNREIHLEVTGTHNPFVPARVHCHPDNSSPAEGGETEIEDVKVLTQEYAHLYSGLTDEEEDRAREAIESATEDDFFEPEDHEDEEPYYEE